MALVAPKLIESSELGHSAAYPGLPSERIEPRETRRRAVRGALRLGRRED